MDAQTAWGFREGLVAKAHFPPILHDKVKGANSYFPSPYTHEIFVKHQNNVKIVSAAKDRD